MYDVLCIDVYFLSCTTVETAWCAVSTRCLQPPHCGSLSKEEALGSLLPYFYAGEGVEVVVVLDEYLPVAEDLACGGAWGVCRVRVVDSSGRG